MNSEDKDNIGRDNGREAAWNDEIARRIREVEEGNVECVSHEDVMERARAACR